MQTAEFLDKSRAGLRDLVRAIISLDTILLLKKELSPGPDRSEFALNVYDRYDPAIIGIYREAGREITEPRARRRFNHRLKFYQLTLEGDTVAATWLIPPGRRFLDEAGYQLPVPEGAVWIRDIFVSPRYRGRKIFSVLLDVLSHRILKTEREIWSDTESRNRSSLQAHLNSGFKIVDSLQILRLKKLLLIRLRRPRRASYIDGFQTSRRIVPLAAAYRKYRDLYLA